MAFPVAPADGTIYTTGFGTRYKYYAADDKWVKDGMVPIGNQGVTGIAGATTGIINIIIDGGGAPVATGVKGDIVLPARIKINSWSLLGTPTGYMNISLQKDTYANYPPGLSGSMSIGATGPYIGAGIKNQSTTVGWASATGAQGDIIRIVIDSCTGIQMAGLSLNYYLY